MTDKLTLSGRGGMRRSFVAVAQVFALCLAGGLSACSNIPQLAELGEIEMPQFGEIKLLQFGAKDAPSIQRVASGDNVELILHPVAVWDETGAAPPVKVSADGREFMARQRTTSFLEKSFARAGLFWDSRLTHIFMPIVVLGPPVDIRRVEVFAGGNQALLRRANSNFKFAPSQSSLDKDEISSAVFEMKSGTLRAVAAADTARLVIHTNRGILNLGLDVVVGDSPDDYQRNARVLFAQFAEKMTAEKAGE